MRDTLFLLLATLLWGLWGVADKYALTRAHPFTVQWMYSLPYIFFIPVWLYLSYRLSADHTLKVDPVALGWALLASMASISAMLLLFFVLQHRPASLAVAFTAAYPLVTLAIGVLAGQETLSWPKVIGIALIVAGVIVVQSVE